PSAAKGRTFIIGGVDRRLLHRETDQPITPIRHSRLHTAPLCHFGRGPLDLMTAVLAPDNDPDPRAAALPSVIGGPGFPVSCAAQRPALHLCLSVRAGRALSPGSAAIGVLPRTSRTSPKPWPPSLSSPLFSWLSGGSPGRKLRSAIHH